MIEMLLIVLGIALVAGIVLWLVLRRRKSGDPAVAHFRCPGCKRRLRYREAQVGHKGRCSNCGRDLVFPPFSQSID